MKATKTYGTVDFNDGSKGRKCELMVDINNEMWIADQKDSVMTVRTDFELYRNFSCTELTYVLDDGAVKIKTSIKHIEAAKKRLSKSRNCASKAVKAEVFIK